MSLSRDLAEQGDVRPQVLPDQLLHLGGVAAAGDEQPGARVPADDGAHRLEQHRQALARLVEPAEEADGGPVAPRA